MRKLLVSAVVTASLALLAAAPASAVPENRQDLPDAACNQGTARAAEAQGRFNWHVPHDHGVQGNCMTMPGLGPPPPIS